MTLTFTGCFEDSGSYSDEDDYGYYDDDDDDDDKTKDAYEDFNKDVDEAGNGDGKADWDDWNAYAEENGYNKAY